MIIMKTSETDDIPKSLAKGELAFSFKSNILFIGNPNNIPIPIALITTEQQNYLKLKYDLDFTTNL